MEWFGVSDEFYHEFAMTHPALPMLVVMHRLSIIIACTVFYLWAVQSQVDQESHFRKCGGPLSACRLPSGIQIILVSVLADEVHNCYKELYSILTAV